MISGGRFREVVNSEKRLSGLDCHRPLSRPVMFRRKRKSDTGLAPGAAYVNRFSREPY